MIKAYYPKFLFRAVGVNETDRLSVLILKIAKVRSCHESWMKIYLRLTNRPTDVD